MHFIDAGLRSPRMSDSDLMNSDLIFWISYEFLLMWYVEVSGGTSTSEIRFDFHFGRRQYRCDVS